MENKFPPIKGRVYNYLKTNNIPLSSFFQKIQISDSAFKGRSAKSEFGGDIITKIVEAYGDISPRWLLTGEGTAEEFPPSISTGVVRGDNNIVASSGAQVHSPKEVCPTTQHNDSLIRALLEQLAEKDRQLREKDKQIELILRSASR